MFNSEEPPHKKRKEEVCLLQSLPDEIAISWLARASALDYANLFHVSKSYRSLVTSSYLYKMRSLMDRTETNVYVCLRTPHEPLNPKWYILRPREEFNLIPITSLRSQPPEESSVVVLDWRIYLIGGLINGNPTSSVWVLDCRTHTWHIIPSMKVARANAAVGVVDGKIYVFGGHKINIGKSLSWGEVFDPKTQTWHNFEKNQYLKEDGWPIWSSIVVDKKVYAMDGHLRFLYYSPNEESKWGSSHLIELLEDTSGCIGDWCVIDNIVYCLDSFGDIHWFEPDELNWVKPYHAKNVKGLESVNNNLDNSRLIHFNEEDVALWDQETMKDNRHFTRKYVDLLTGARMCNSDGKIILFWDIIKGDHLEIWCAEISLERRHGGEIWGNIQQSKAIMSTNHFIDHYKVLHSVSVTV